MFRGLTSILAMMMAGMAQMAWALSCVPILFVEPDPGATGPITLTVAAPGEPGYDAQAYGAHLYGAFAGSVNNEETVVLIGRIEPVDGPEAVFMHQVLQEEYMRYPRDPDYGIPADNISFHYREAFRFEGLALTGTELTEHRDFLLDFEAFLEEEMSAPIPAYGEMVIFDVIVRGSRLVYEPWACPRIAPAPDEAAVAVFMACVANGGCSGE